MTGDTLAVVSRVSRSYGARLAVDDVSFEVRRGEVLGLLGPNGAGKTSTMQMLCGVIAPSGGSITVGGHDIVEAPRAAKARIGYLPERPPLYPDLGVDQYLDFCAALRRVPRARRAAAVRAARDRCGLAGVGGRRIGNLSRGYQQRTGIAQAIVHDPELIVLDEPTVGLDPAQLMSIRALIRELGADHGVLISTHILSEVHGLCGRVLIIGGGRLLLDQSLAALDTGSGSEFFVALRAPPPLEALRAVPGVAAAAAAGPQRFVISGEPGADAAVAVSEAAARGGWGLFELVPRAGALEETFLRLTGAAMPAEPAPC
jgi:ABC-2 type transport system ATP-binding protein